jgi:hypothetical protein
MDIKEINIMKRQKRNEIVELIKILKEDVGYLAKEYFNGGGHKNADVGFLEMDIDSAKSFVLDKLKEYLNNLV